MNILDNIGEEVPAKDFLEKQDAKEHRVRLLSHTATEIRNMTLQRPEHRNISVLCEKNKRHWRAYRTVPLPRLLEKYLVQWAEVADEQVQQGKRKPEEERVIPQDEKENQFCPAGGGLRTACRC